MADLHEHLRRIERNPAPDLWREITARPARAAPHDRRGTRHRVVAGLTAAVVSVAAIGFLVWAFRPADPSGVGGQSAPIPTHAELTCAADGTASLSTDTTQPMPDGVHLRVNNEYDEPVSVEGFDADPGITDWVLTNGPGTMELMCWPFSQHEGDEPQRVPLGIVDPLGLYVDGSLACVINVHATVYRAKTPIDEGPPPLDVARKAIDGLRPDDVLRVAGYPEQEGASVIVIRDGEVVARYGIKRFKGKPWDAASGSACKGTGLPFAGESYG